MGFQRAALLLSPRSVTAEPNHWATLISILASIALLLHVDGDFLRHALAGERNVCSVGAL